MSAKLMKALAAGRCLVTNRRSGQVRVYWEDENDLQDKTRYLDIDGHAVHYDLTAHIPIAALRKSKSLKKLVHDDHLMVE